MVAHIDEHRAGPSGTRHRLEEVGGGPLHWVEAGTAGAPVLLVHGFPETWWAFHRLIPLLAARHRVIAVDLPGFGDSAPRPGAGGSAEAAAALHALVLHLGAGPVHLLGQDLAGNAVVRLALQHPDDVLSLTAVETLVSGFGFERLGDAARGGAWHVGAIATPGVAEFVFAGRVEPWLAATWFPAATRVPGAVTDADVRVFARAYERPGAWDGPRGLYASALREGDELSALAAAGLRPSVLAVDGMGRASTAAGLRPIAPRLTSVLLDGTGHHVALEAPEALAEALLQHLDVASPTGPAAA